jgi:hypothetical protein
MQVIKARDGMLSCRLLTGPRAGTEVLLPKIKFTYGNKPNHRGIRFTRIQFPVRLCFSMTVNKVVTHTFKSKTIIEGSVQYIYLFADVFFFAVTRPNIEARWPCTPRPAMLFTWTSKKNMLCFFPIHFLRFTLPYRELPK